MKKFIQKNYQHTYIEVIEKQCFNIIKNEINYENRTETMKVKGKN